MRCQHSAAESLNQTKMFLSSLNLWQIIFATSSFAKADVLKLPKPELEPQPISISCNIYRHYPTRPCFSTVCVGWVMVIIDIKVSNTGAQGAMTLAPILRFLTYHVSSRYHLGIILWRLKTPHLRPGLQCTGRIPAAVEEDPSKVISTLNLSLPRSSPGLNGLL